MANAPTPPMPIPTPFWGLGFRFDSIGRKFDDTYHDIKEVWLIGPYLAWPFYFIGYTFFGARDLSWEADGFVKDIKKWVDGIVSGNTFAELFYNLAYHTWQLIRDPRGWTIDRLREVSNDLYSLYTNAKAWIEVKVIDSFPFMSQMRYDMRGWAIGLIATTFGSGLDILLNPRSYVIDRISEKYPFLSSLLYSPASYIIGLVNSRYPSLIRFLDNPEHETFRYLTNLYPDLFLLYINPRQWFEDKLLDVFGLQVDPMLGFTLSVLKGILDGLSHSYGTARDRITTVLCDVLLTFI